MNWDAVRKWVYTVLTAAVPLLILYGVFDDEEATLWLAVALAVLGFPLAAANVTKGKSEAQAELVAPPVNTTVPDMPVSDEADYVGAHVASDEVAEEPTDYPDLDALSEPRDKEV